MTERTNHASTVVEEVARAKGVDPLELDPLYNAVEGDALDALLSHADGTVTVTFEYEGYRVSIHGDGRIALE